MQFREASIADKHCVIAEGTLAARALIIISEDESMAFYQSTLDAAFQDTPYPSIVFMRTKKWNEDLSPWPAQDRANMKLPRFARRLSGGAKRYEAEDFLPVIEELKSAYGIFSFDFLGYSLAGLFGHWLATQEDVFSNLYLGSPSLWYPGYIDYINSSNITANTVRVAIGEDEAKGNPLFQDINQGLLALEKKTQGQGIEISVVKDALSHFSGHDTRIHYLVQTYARDIKEQEANL